jgi:hypothetical protein
VGRWQIQNRPVIPGAWVGSRAFGVTRTRAEWRVWSFGMRWKGVDISPRRRHYLIRGIQVSISALALTVLIYLTRTSFPELALTLYFLYTGPIVVTAYTWNKEIAGLLILTVVSFFALIMIGTVANTGDGSIELAQDLVVRALELVSSLILFGILSVIGERAGGHRRQRDRYRQLDRLGERFSRELQVEELLQVILDQTVPMFEAAGGDIAGG